jgi:hypothetical protein
MVKVGDIVTINHHADGLRWVVMELVGSASGWPLDVRLARNAGHGMIGTSVSAANLAVVGSPTFEVGESVGVGPLRGVVAAPHSCERVKVRLDAHARPLRGGGALQIDGAFVEAPFAQLVLENRK